MIRTLTKIQWLQFKRELKNAGFLYVVIFFIILAVIYIVFFNFVRSFYGSILTLLFIIIAVFGIHQKRADKIFVLHYLPKPRRNFVLEYLLFASPLLFPLFWSPHPPLVVIAVGFIILICNTKPPKTDKARFPWLRKLFKSGNFEWLSGVRKNLYGIVFLLLMAIALLYFPFASLLPLFFLTNLIISFYQEDEPQNILITQMKKPGSFLRKKCLSGVSSTAALYAIPLLPACYLYPEVWYVYLLFLLTQLVAIEFAIFHKYKMYTPNTRNNKNEIILGIVALFSVIPFFLPVPFIFAFREYYLAKKNLRYYTHA